MEDPQKRFKVHIKKTNSKDVGKDVGLVCLSDIGRKVAPVIHCSVIAPCTSTALKPSVVVTDVGVVALSKEPLNASPRAVTSQLVIERVEASGSRGVQSPGSQGVQSPGSQGVQSTGAEGVQSLGAECVSSLF